MADETGEAPFPGIPAELVVRLNHAAAVTRLLPAIVHDLNNALLVIGGSVELLDDGALSGQQFPRVERIRIQQQRAAAVLRTLTAVLAGGDDPGGAADLRVVVNQALDLRKSTFARRGIAARVECPSGPVVARIGTGALLQIVLNLVANAEVAVGGAADRAVTLAIAADLDRAVLTVTDTGAGVEAGIEAELFEPFASGTPGTSAGLGLAASRRLAEAAGGTLTLLPMATGARFELRLPLARA